MPISVKVGKLKAKEIFRALDPLLKPLFQLYGMDYEVDMQKLEGKVSIGPETYGKFKVQDGFIEFSFEGLNLTPFALQSDSGVDAWLLAQLRNLDS